MGDNKKRILNVEMIAVKDLKPYINNPRKNDKAVDMVETSIREFGFINPIVLDKDNCIIVGHTRLKAAIRLGYETVPTLRVDDLTPEQVKAFRIMDNKSGETAEWDLSLLKEEFYNLEGKDEFNYTGFESEEITEVWEYDENKEVQEDNFQEPKVAKYKVELGDVFCLGSHRLMCGDATDFAMVKTLLDGGTVDMVFTDPPYLMDFQGNVNADGSKSLNAKHGGIKNDKMSKEDGDKFLDKINDVIKEICEGSWYINFYRLGIGQYWDSLNRNDMNVRSLIIWEKGNHTLSNSDYMSKYEPIFYGWNKKHDFYGGNNGMDIWNISRTKKNDLHPTMKPLELCSRAIKNSSKPNQTVLDLFGGSGSTLIACEQTDRKCYMMELDEHYVSVIMERWEKLTGKRAQKIGGGYPELKDA